MGERQPQLHLAGVAEDALPAGAWAGGDEQREQRGEGEKSPLFPALKRSFFHKNMGDPERWAMDVKNGRAKLLGSPRHMASLNVKVSV